MTCSIETNANLYSISRFKKGIEKVSDFVLLSYGLILNLLNRQEVSGKKFHSLRGNYV